MWVEFRHPAVRDLAWAIGSPPLLDAGSALYRDNCVTRRWCQRAFRDSLPWLRELDRHPAPLEQWLEGRHSHLLGYYFEALIEFWLRHWPRVQFIAGRTPVYRNGRAFGEFDFLFRDHERGRPIHWEVAVKFFLRHRLPDGSYRWLGPNPRDTLDAKLAKVFGHQLHVGTAPEAAEVFERLGLEQRPQPEAFIKGYLFYPAESDWRHPLPIPSGVAPDHLRGWWTRAGARTIPRQQPESRWVVLERMQWLSPARSVPRQGLEWGPLNRWLDEHFATGARPVLLAELAPAGPSLREISRGFVVPEQWPA